MPGLCTELILKIIDEVKVDEDHATARSCSEVARYWVFPARSLLFHTIRVDLDTDVQSWNSLLNVNAKLHPDFAVPIHVRRVIIWSAGQATYGPTPVSMEHLIRRFDKITILDLHGAVSIDWNDLRVQPLSLVWCLNLQGWSLSVVSTSITESFPSLSVLNVRDTVLSIVNSSAKDEEAFMTGPPILRVMSVDSLWGTHLVDLIQLFRTIPSYWNVEMLDICCSPRVMDRFFESLPHMKMHLKSLRCRPRGRSGLFQSSFQC